MARHKKWQSGSADLVSVAVGMVILSIAATGTAASMIYGREVLGRQERYKVAAYLLRKEMEKKIWELQSFPRASSDAGVQPWLRRVELISSHERLTGNQPVDLEISMERIAKVSDLEFDNVTAYYVLTMHARWREPEMAGSRDPVAFQERHISYRTAVDARY